MKTVGEFVRRLQVDAEFERKARAFDNGDELTAFVKSEGYDFTLEQLASEFNRAALGPSATWTVAPTDKAPSAPPQSNEAPVPGGLKAFPHGSHGTALPGRRGDSSIRGQPTERMQRAGEGTGSQGLKEKPPGECPRVSGGRHRGFSPQRLKSITGEDPEARE